MANYDRCYENPAATGCPGNYDVTKSRSMCPHIATRERRMSRAARRVTTASDGQAVYAEISA